MSPATGRWVSYALALWFGWVVAGFAIFIAVSFLVWPAALEGAGASPFTLLAWYAAGLIPMAIGMPLLLLALVAVSRRPAYRLEAIGLGVLAAALHSATIIGLYGLPGPQLVYLGLAATVPRAPGRPVH